jgi:putative inorganic carbon (HCO3(-)) transporter
LKVNDIKRAQVNSFTFVLYMYFVIDFFLHLSARSQIYGALRPTLILIVLITLMLFVQQGKFKERVTAPETKALNVFIFYILISLPFVGYAGSVIQFHIPNFIKAVVFFYFTIAIIDSPKRLKIFMFIFISVQVIRVLEPLYMNITDGYWGDFTYKGSGEFENRLAGAPTDIINPNELGFVIVTILPFLHYLLLPKGFFIKILYFSLAIALLYAMILTMSRGAILALLIIAWMVFKKSKRKLMLIMFGCIFIIAGWSQLNSFQKDRYLSLVGESNASGMGASTKDGRINGIIEEMLLGLKRPIVGHGVGTTPEVKYNKGGGRQASHNMYGELLIETGIIGFILFFRFLFAIGKSLKKITLNYEECERLSEEKTKREIFQFDRQLNFAMIAIFFMYLVYSINYYGVSQYYWYLFAGLTVVCYRQFMINTDNGAIKDGEK